MDSGLDQTFCEILLNGKLPNVLFYQFQRCTLCKIEDGKIESAGCDGAFCGNYCGTSSAFMKQLFQLP